MSNYDDVPPKTLRRALGVLGIPQTRFAEAIGVDPRTVRRWCLGETKIPALASLLLSYWLLTGVAPSGLSELADQLDAVRQPRS